MNARSQIICAAIMASLTSVVSPHGTNGQTPARVRTITHQDGVPITKRLLETDQVVRINRTGHGLMSNERPTVDQEIDYSAGVSPVILRAKLLRATGILLEDNSWIGTKLSFSSSGASLVGKGQTPPAFDVTWTGGGVLYFDNIRVEAGAEWVVEPEAEMLLFIGKNPDTQQLYLSRTPLVIENGVLQNPWQRMSANDVLHGVRLRDLENRIKK